MEDTQPQKVLGGLEWAEGWLQLASGAIDSPTVLKEYGLGTHRTHCTVLGFVDYRIKETAQQNTAQHLGSSPPQFCYTDTLVIT